MRSWYTWHPVRFAVGLRSGCGLSGDDIMDSMDRRLWIWTEP